ncbi:hypothetical protein H1C71_017740, partial [Ictidomys tridecemlineatus]
VGIPKQLKIDNAPGYTSTSFKQFCSSFGITHITGIPYNPQGQGIVERAHQTIKMYLLKQKDGIGKGYIFPKDKLKIWILNLDSSGLSAAERHMCPKNVHKPKVLWK